MAMEDEKTRLLRVSNAYGIIQGGLWALDCDPAPVVLGQFVRCLHSLESPIAGAKRAVERAKAAQQHLRVCVVLASLDEEKKVTR
jgi:hypothetical protein